MTSVVGILNKRGVALAADSAVTRNHTFDGEGHEKVTNNGNKMIRLCESSPICLMVTGRADFLGIPWDIIARRYRKCRGTVEHPSLESAVDDFFRFMSETKQFWDATTCNDNIKMLVRSVYANSMGNLSGHKSWSVEDLMENLEDELDDITECSRHLCPDFSDYSAEDFSERVRVPVDIVFAELSKGKGVRKWPAELLESSREALVEALYSRFKRQYDEFPNDMSYTRLIFCGYDMNSPYPSLVPVMVKGVGGIDGRISYYYREEEIVRISDSRPAAICPFAQADVMETVLKDSSEGWRKKVVATFSSALTDRLDGRSMVDSAILQDIENMSDERHGLKQSMMRTLGERSQMNWRIWESYLPAYDLESMADLAENLIELTKFNRILTFQHEGVGGTVDLATISKDGGFSWLNRKGWYHGKDTDGLHGKLGI